MKGPRLPSLPFALFISQITYTYAATCTTELVLASVFGGLFALLIVILVIYFCVNRCRRDRRGKTSQKTLASSVEEGASRFSNPSMEFSASDLELDGRKRLETRTICSQCHHRMIRANVEMPTAIENSGLSTSEERLPVNGGFSSGQGLPSRADEPRIFVFVEKLPGESLGLYLVPFEEEPLSGLFVKTVIPDKAADRLKVFDPGDKIVTVNGKSLSGLSYRESTDFIRQCPGPNVKMGIIKHALHTKEDLERLASLSVFQSESAANIDIQAPGLSLDGSTSAYLSGNAPKVDVGGGRSSKEVIVDAPVTIAKSDVSYNVESTPDFSMDLDVDPNFNSTGKNGVPGEDSNVDFTAPSGIFGDSEGPEEQSGMSGSAEALDFDSDSSVENHPPKDSRQASSTKCRRSHSNPQIRPRVMVDFAANSSQSPNLLAVDYPSRFPEKELPVSGDVCNPPLATSVFRAGNPCAVSTPLSQRSPVSSNSFLSSYLVPLSDQSRPDWMGNVGMIKSKSLDKLDEIMRNDPILRDDYLRVSPSSKSTQTQTETIFKIKKPRRKRNDRPRSQILPPTYLELPSVTRSANDLASGDCSKNVAPTTETRAIRNDLYGTPNYVRATHRRRSKEEQAQIVQRWIDEMIEHKKAQELRRQNIVRQSVGRERSTKLKKKSRSVPEHTFRGSPSKFERRRAYDDSDELHRGSDEEAKLRHSGSDPTFRRQRPRKSGEDGYPSVFAPSAESTPGIGGEERISPSLQSRIRSFEKSHGQNNKSVESLKPPVLNNSSSPQVMKRSRASNLDLPLISHLLSGGELGSLC